MQICASQNDLFALDGDGYIYRYNFNTKTWVTLHRDVDRSGQMRDTNGDGVL